ncbi:MAG: disulfide bond formation protein B, partial [Acidobacteria bacterium]
MEKRSPIYVVVSLAVLALSIVPVGGAVFVLGFGAGDSPCVMCWEQRIGMIIIALIGLFVLRYGPRPKYIGLAVLVASWGIFMALRHTAMHAARDIGQGFSLEILGAHTYTWALFIYWVCALTMGVLLFLTRDADLAPRTRPSTFLERAAMSIFLAVVAANAVQAFVSTGPPPFVGQSDPVRFSFNPKHWVWSLEEWSPSPVSLRGRWAVGKPDISRTNADPASGPLSGPAPLPIIEQTRVTAPLRGTPSGLAYDDVNDHFAITTERGVHILDATLTTLVRYTVLDTGFSVDIDRLADAAFLAPGT